MESALLALEHNFSRPSYNLTYVPELTICWISCDGETYFIGQNLLSSIPFLSCFPTHSATLDCPIGCKPTSSINDMYQSSFSDYSLWILFTSYWGFFWGGLRVRSQAGSIVFHCLRPNIDCQLLTGHVFTHAILVKHLQFEFLSGS